MEARRELMIDALLHPLFPLLLRLGARSLSEPRKMVTGSLGRRAVEQIAMRIDDGLTDDPRLAIERFQSPWNAQRPEADAGTSGRCCRKFICEINQLLSLPAAVLQPEAHGHIDSSCCLATMADGRR